MAHTAVVGECIEWVGRRSEKGYGRIRFHGRDIAAHRIAYEAAIGPIPAGLQIDHLCRNPRCVNPLHLEPVTAKENVRRSESLAAKNAVKSHCKHGHAFTPENIIRKRGYRHCRICQRAATRDYMRKVRSAAK